MRFTALDREPKTAPQSHFKGILTYYFLHDATFSADNQTVMATINCFWEHLHNLRGIFPFTFFEYTLIKNKY